MIGHSVKVIYRKNHKCAGSAPFGELILENQIEENCTISNVQLEWQLARVPIYSVWGAEKNRRERKKEARETWFKLQQFCISHQENGIRFHRSDLIWYSNCRNCISYQDKWEITGRHLERDIRIGLISARLQMLHMLCHGEQSGSRNHYDDHLIPKV